MNLKKALALTTGAVLATTLLLGCSQGRGNQGGGTDPKTLGAVLQRLDYGRLVDIYAYRRVTATKADRRDTPNRVATLILRGVVVRPDIESDTLFEVTGEERTSANYRFMPFDVNVGHEELLILWDDLIPGEKDKFQTALKSATSGLPSISASYRDQNTARTPIPVVPRNAALKLVFDRELPLTDAFFQANPNALQLLQFITRNGSAAYRPIPTRVMMDKTSNNTVVVDTSIVGGEAKGGRNTPGLPPSDDSVSANVRIALPTAGVVSKQLKVAPDGVAQLNGVDSRGDTAVIRDFRSGNLADGPVGALADVDAPMVVGQFGMGVIEINTAERTLTLNKRFADVALRGRVPFVDGAIDPKTGLPGGPGAIPTEAALRSGDVITQQVISSAGEVVTIRAQVVMNMGVGNTLNDKNFPTVGMAADGSDGGAEPTLTVKVDTIEGVDSFGNTVTFEKNTLPLGKDCQVKVHYYENVQYQGSFGNAVVSDRARIAHFLVIDPEPPLIDANRNPVPRGTRVDPMASISLRFSEPMDILSVKPQINFMLTNATFTASNVTTLIKEPKPASLAILATKRLDENGDGTLWRLNPPVGHFHEKGGEEAYWFHLMLGDETVSDLSGRKLDIFDRRNNPVANFSVQYALEKDANTNAVGYRIFRFEAQDEDGTANGSIDFFGQFQLRGGALRGASVTRFARVADPQILSGITRFDRGECSVPGTGSPPGPPSYAPFANIPGILYQCPRHLAIQPGPPQSFTPPAGAQPGGGVKEPHQPRGSRLQMTYREDDFGLSYTDPAEFMLDIEQMHWAPWNANVGTAGSIFYDIFDRYTLKMSHSDYRPDLGFIVVNNLCAIDTFSLRSGLQTTFLQNVLEGTTQETVVKDKTYVINPNNSFKSTTDVTFLPYPKFEKNYTWRDQRLVTWDTKNNRAVGLGGSHQADADQAVRDTTVSISSPWIPDIPPTNIAALHQTGDYVWDHGDFLGFRKRDHNPIAMPLLMDFSIFPDDPKNGFAKGDNLFFVALVGPCWPLPGHGFYNPNYPSFRVHANGGRDPINNKDIFIDPANQTTAQRSWIKDIFLGDPRQGIFQSFPNDDHLHWAQADFVRRVSLVTFGFWDTLLPNRHDFNNSSNELTTSWPGKGVPSGIPNLTALPKGDQMGIEDFVTIMDPPLAEQPQGTGVSIEFRGASKFDNNGKIFDQQADSTYTTVNIVQQRGNLLNPLYACEAYRYAMPNEFAATYFNFTPMPTAGPRVKAEGLTPYILEEKLDSIRHPVSGLLPRYMNFRVIFENNLDVNPPLAPFLRSFAVAYRVSLGK